VFSEPPDEAELQHLYLEAQDRLDEFIEDQANCGKLLASIYGGGIVPTSPNTFGAD